MIPIKNKKYKISYTDPNNKIYDYFGVGVYSGHEEHYEDETVFLFCNLENLNGYTGSGFFADQDILELLDE